MRTCLIAWHQLANSRTSILGARKVKGTIVPYSRRGPIPYPAIIAWAKQNRISREFTEVLVDVIGLLDHDREEAAISKESLG